MQLARLACVAVTLLQSPCSFAHDYFFARTGGELVLEQGHESSAHAGDDTVPYDASIVQDAHCLGPDGQQRAVPKPTVSPARFDGGCDMLFVTISSGFWSETPKGTVNEPKSRAADAFYSWSSTESIKLIERWQPAAARPLGHGLELTTAASPLQLKARDKITVRATWHGEPRAGVTVAYDGVPRGTTAADGTINIRLRHGGRQLITAGFDEPLDSPEADFAVHATVLQFQIAE